MTVLRLAFLTLALGSAAACSDHEAELPSPAASPASPSTDRKYTGFVMPKLTPVVGTDDRRIADVTISYPMDLTTQMLEYSGVKSAASISQTR